MANEKEKDEKKERRDSPKESAPSPAAPAASPASPQHDNAAETAGKWTGILGAIAFVLSGFKSEDGRIVLKKGLQLGGKVIQLGWRHYTRDRGRVSQVIGEIEPYVVRTERALKRQYVREERARRGRRGFFSLLVNAAIPKSPLFRGAPKQKRRHRQVRHVAVQQTPQPAVAVQHPPRRQFRWPWQRREEQIAPQRQLVVPAPQWVSIRGQTVNIGRGGERHE
ncbi:MAG: hypothetical protein V1907_03120 [Candidatus Kerfeldbacteria bacterium]